MPSFLEAMSRDWNPYALAYAMATDAPDPRQALKRDGNGSRFINWIRERWSEFRIMHGIGEYEPANHRSDEMIEFLEAYLEAIGKPESGQLFFAFKARKIEAQP